MRSGMINVYKEKGYTSFDVVAKLRGILKERRIGHTGTLDPDAEGVLPVCLGKGTKLCGMLTDEDKEYETVLLLGRVTDTQDISGKILEERQVELDEMGVIEAVHSFEGEYSQIPPMYSALKVCGKKLYELAREGRTVERSPRKVQIFSIEIEDICLPRVRMKVRCSKGTYIRTLCEDIGRKLGCGGCMEELVRTRVGSFCLEGARTLSQIEKLEKDGREKDFLMPVERAFDACPAFMVKKKFEKAARNGNKLELGWLEAMDGRKPDGGQVCIFLENHTFVGVYQMEKAGIYRPVRIFYEG